MLLCKIGISILQYLCIKQSVERGPGKYGKSYNKKGCLKYKLIFVACPYEIPFHLCPFPQSKSDWPPKRHTSHIKRRRRKQNFKWKVTNRSSLFIHWKNQHWVWIPLWNSLYAYTKCGGEDLWQSIIILLFYVCIDSIFCW